MLCLVQFSASLLTWCLDNSSLIGKCWLIVGTLWSAVATICLGRNKGTPLFSIPLNAWGLVTSWIKCLSMYSTEGPFGIVFTMCLSQILSNNVFAIVAKLKK